MLIHVSSFWEYGKIFFPTPPHPPLTHPLLFTEKSQAFGFWVLGSLVFRGYWWLLWFRGKEKLPDNRIQSRRLVRSPVLLRSLNIDYYWGGGKWRLQLVLKGENLSNPRFHRDERENPKCKIAIVSLLLMSPYCNFPVMLNATNISHVYLIVCCLIPTPLSLPESKFNEDGEFIFLILITASPATLLWVSAGNRWYLKG